MSDPASTFIWFFRLSFTRFLGLTSSTSSGARYVSDYMHLLLYSESLLISFVSHQSFNESSFDNRGHSTATWTEFCHFLPPSSLRGQFLYPERGQKQTFFDPLQVRPNILAQFFDWLFLIRVY